MTTVTKLTGITLPGTGYPDINSFKEIYMSVTSGLIGLYSIRDTLAFSLNNYATGGSPMTVVGAPTMSGDGAVCNYANCFDTGIATQTAYSFLALAKPTLSTDATQNCMIVSSYFQPSAGQNAGDSIGFAANGTTNPRFRNYSQNSTSSVIFADAGVTGFSESSVAFFAGVTSLTDGVRLAFGHGGSLSIGTPTTLSARNITGAGTILVGGHRGPSTFFPAFGKGIYAVAIYNRAITNAEITQGYADLSSYAVDRGITTV